MTQTPWTTHLVHTRKHYLAVCDDKTFISQTEVADILNEVLPTDVVKYIASYHAHPLASMRPWCFTWYHGEDIGQDWHVRVLLKVVVSKYAPSRSMLDIANSVPAGGSLGYDLYLSGRWWNINDGAEARGIPDWVFPLTPKNTKKEILDFAAKQSIKLSMSWTKTKMLMVFNSKYGA